MRRIAITLFLIAMTLFLPLVSTAQGRSPSFDGVPLRGDAMVVSGALRAKGWSLVEAADHVVVLKGSWKGFQDVKVTVLESDDGAAVASLTALVPVSADWPTMTAAWEDVVDAGVKAWGPAERIRTRILVTGDFSDEEKPMLVQDGRCEWKATWTLNHGEAVTDLAFLPFSYYVRTVITIKR